MCKVAICVFLFAIMIQCNLGSAFSIHTNVADSNITKLSNDIYRAGFGGERLSVSKCECAGYGCGCCVHMNVPKLHLNDTGCVNMTYLPKDYGLTLTCTIDKFVILNETISARSPPPLCFGEEYLPVGGVICLHFYDLDATLTKLHGCAEIYAKLGHIVLAKYDLGCFDLGHASWKNSSVVYAQPPVMTKKVYIPRILP